MAELDAVPASPVGRLWIDVEEVPVVPRPYTDCDRARTINLIGEALDACGPFVRDHQQAGGRLHRKR
jgi:hypothetical protein